MSAHTASEKSPSVEPFSLSAAEDEELTSLLLQKIWQGKLPTKISLAANESKSFTNSPPLYVALLLV
jgi:hypothetical protein